MLGVCCFIQRKKERCHAQSLQINHPHVQCAYSIHSWDDGSRSMRRRACQAISNGIFIFLFTIVDFDHRQTAKGGVNVEKDPLL
jgi:hypothetical protein